MPGRLQNRLLHIGASPQTPPLLKKVDKTFAFFGAKRRKARGQGVPDPLRVREGSALAKRFWDFAKALKLCPGRLQSRLLTFGALAKTLRFSKKLILYIINVASEWSGPGFAA